MTAPRLPDAELLRLLELESKATPGGWGHWAYEGQRIGGDHQHSFCRHVGPLDSDTHECVGETRNPLEELAFGDCMLIVASRNALRSLVTELIELRAENARLDNELCGHSDNCFEEHK